MLHHLHQLVCCIVLVSLFTAPADSQSTQAQEAAVPTLHEALVGEVNRLNPLFANLNPVEADITSLIYEGLTRINQYGEPVGLLAEDWFISRDGLEYVMYLRDDVTWQDGIPFTADDVIYTMSVLSSVDFPGDPALGGFWRTVETVKIDEHTVRFRLTQPLGSFLTRLTVGILPEHALRGIQAAQLARHPFNLSPIGTGPYQLEALRGTEDRITAVDLRVSPVYRQRPEGQQGFTVERIRFHLFATFTEAVTALEAGRVDALATRSMDERLPVINIPATETYTRIAPAVGMLIFNYDEGEGRRFFQEPRVRNALQMGLNRAAPVESHLANRAIVADSPLLFSSWAYNSAIQSPGTDVAAARAMLQNANIRLGETVVELGLAAETAEAPGEAAGENPTVEEGFPRVPFSILTRDEPALVRVAQEIAAQWSQLNLDVTVDAVPVDEHRQRVRGGDFDTAIIEIPLDTDPDVYAYWHAGQHEDGQNYGAAADDRISELLERARREHNGINRKQLYDEFQQLFIDRAIAIPLYYPLYTYTVRDRVDNIQLGFIGSPEHRFRTIADWQISGG